MESVINNNMEWCTDDLLEIMTEVLHTAAELKKADESSTRP